MDALVTLGSFKKCSAKDIISYFINSALQLDSTALQMFKPYPVQEYKSLGQGHVYNI